MDTLPAELRIQLLKLAALHSPQNLISLSSISRRYRLTYNTIHPRLNLIALQTVPLHFLRYARSIDICERAHANLKKGRKDSGTRHEIEGRWWLERVIGELQVVYEGFEMRFVERDKAAFGLLRRYIRDIFTVYTNWSEGSDTNFSRPDHRAGNVMYMAAKNMEYYNQLELWLLVRLQHAFQYLLDQDGESGKLALALGLGHGFDINRHTSGYLEREAEESLKYSGMTSSSRSNVRKWDPKGAGQCAKEEFRIMRFLLSEVKEMQPQPANAITGHQVASIYYTTGHFNHPAIFGAGETGQRRLPAPAYWNDDRLYGWIRENTKDVVIICASQISKRLLEAGIQIRWADKDENEASGESVFELKEYSAHERFYDNIYRDDGRNVTEEIIQKIRETDEAFLKDLMTEYLPYNKICFLAQSLHKFEISKKQGKQPSGFHPILTTLFGPLRRACLNLFRTAKSTEVSATNIIQIARTGRSLLRNSSLPPHYCSLRITLTNPPKSSFSKSTFQKGKYIEIAEVVAGDESWFRFVGGEERLVAPESHLGIVSASGGNRVGGQKELGNRMVHQDEDLSNRIGMDILDKLRAKYLKEFREVEQNIQSRMRTSSAMFLPARTSGKNSSSGASAKERGTLLGYF